MKQVKLTLIPIGRIGLRSPGVADPLGGHLLILEEGLGQLVCFRGVNAWCSRCLFLLETVLHIELLGTPPTVHHRLQLPTLAHHVGVLAPAFVRTDIVLNVVIQRLSHARASHLGILGALRDMRYLAWLTFVEITVWWRPLAG